MRVIINILRFIHSYLMWLPIYGWTAGWLIEATIRKVNKIFRGE